MVSFFYFYGLISILKSKFLHFIFFLFVVQIWAQDPVTIHLTDKEGLPDYEIYDVLEDSNGYIWIAANKGLFRYDGKVYTLFSHPQKRGLSVFGLLQDSKGRIWCNNISGQFFYIYNEKMSLFVDLKDQINGKLSEFKILHNELIALTENGIYKQSIDAKSGNFFKDEEVASVYYHSPFFLNNQFYFIHANNVRKLNDTKISDGLPINFQGKAINKFCYLNVNGKILCVYNDVSSHVLEYKNNKYLSVNLKELTDKNINKLLNIDNEIWICTASGVYIYQIIKDDLVFKRSFLENEVVTNVLKDKNQNYWIATLQNGIFVIPNINILKLNDLNDLKITDLERINSQFILFGTFDGKLGWIDTHNFKTQLFELPSNSKVTKLLFDEVRNVVYVSQDKAGHVWDLKKRKLYNFSQIFAAKTLSIQKNNLLYGTYNNAQMINLPTNHNLSSEKIHQLSKPSYSSTNIQYAFQDLRKKRSYTSAFNDDSFYMGYVDGLFKQEKANLTEIKFQNHSIFSVDLVIDYDKNAWISTFEDGLLKIEKGNKIQNYSIKNGLLSNYLGKLKVDQDKIWIATDNGLQLFDMQTQKFQNLLKSDGLETYDFVDIEITNENVIIASKKGVYLLDKKYCFKEYKTPDVFITSVEVNNEKIANKKKLVLDYDSNSLKIAFNVTGFQKEAFINYQYRLHSNDNWQTLDNGLNFVKYNSLPSGDYSFEVRAINKNGVASKSQTISIEINSPFWQKWWFYLVLSLITVAISWFLFYYNSLKKQQKQEQIVKQAKSERELLFSQLENLRSQMNPHFIFNALNSIQEYIMSNEKDMASTYLVKFSRLIRLYLNQSRNQEVLLKDEVEALKLYLELEKDRFEDTLNYSIDIESNLLHKTIFVPSLFIQPYVENAIKHGLLHKVNDRKLSVQFKQSDAKLICIIDDNGVGRKEAENYKKGRVEQHNSFATTANQKRVVLLNRMRKNKISVAIIDKVNSNYEALGTQVIIEIPFDNESSNH